MQPPTAWPRDELTADQVVELIRDAPAVTRSAGLEVLNRDLTVADDVTDYLAGGSVTRRAYADLHGTATLALNTELDWGSAVVRPYYVLSDGTTTARFNLGAYFTSTPDRNLASGEPDWDVECHDILGLLDDPVGDAYALASGTPYLAAVEQILIDRGWTSYLIDQAASASVLPTDRVWVFDDRTTWLVIINDLLASVGYQGIWSDWDGRLRCTSYIRPIERQSEWTYTTDPVDGMIGQDRSMVYDYYSVPNRWVFYRSNNQDQGTPVDGDGIYGYINQSVGDTSVDARGRVISKVQGMDAADHAALVTAAQSVIDADMHVAARFPMTTFINPLHWHFDRVYVIDPELGVPFDALGTEWTLPFNASVMSHEWAMIA